MKWYSLYTAVATVLSIEVLRFFYLCIQVRVLTDLEMFSEAARVLTSLLRGEKLPKVSDGGFRTVENKTVFPCCLQDNFVSLPLYLRSLVNWIVCDAISFCFCSRHICSALFERGTFDSPQKPPPVFNNKESVMSAGNLAVSDLLWHPFFLLEDITVRYPCLLQEHKVASYM